MMLLKKLSQLEQELQELDDALKDGQAESDRQEGTKAKLESDITRLSKDLEGYKATISKLEKDKAALLKDSSDLEERIRDSEKKAQTLERDNNKLEDEIADWHSKIESSSSKQAGLQKNIKKNGR